jgi:hypothetical protein
LPARPTPLNIRPMRSHPRRLRLIASTTCAFFTLFSATGAFAVDPKKRTVRVALVDVDGNATGDSTDIHYFVEKGVRTSTAPIELMALDDVLNAGAQATDIQNIAFGDEALDNGMKAFAQGDCDEALDQLGQAVTYYEQSMAFLGHFDRFVTVLVHQGICLSRTGHKKPAGEILERAFTVQSKLKFDSFPQEKALFERARKRVRGKALSSIAVSSSPDGARVFVNGRYRGVAPAYRPGLRRGVHFVRVERQGYGRRGIKVDTSSGTADAKVDLSIKSARKKPLLESLLAGLQTEFGAEQAGTNIARLQGLLLVDYVILYRASGASTKKKVELVLYDLVSGSRLNQVSGTADWDARSRAAKNAVISLTQELLSVELTTLVTVDPNPGVEPNPDPDPEPGGGGDSIVNKWWFWTAIGAVVLAGTTVGLVLGLQTDDAPSGLGEDGNGALILRF